MIPGVVSNVLDCFVLSLLFFLSFLYFCLRRSCSLFFASLVSVGDGLVCGCSMVLLGMLGFTNFVLERGTIDGAVSEGGVEEGSVAKGVVGDGSFSEVNGGFVIVSVSRGFSTFGGDSKGSLGSTNSKWLTIS